METFYTLLTCFWEFFKTGLFAMGGGLSTIPFLQEMADKYPEWFTREELTGFIAISESTPGPIGINIATYAGYKIAVSEGLPGPVGSLICTVSLVLPSFIIILLIAKVLDKFKSSPIVEGAFVGIRPATTSLITAAVLTTFAEVLMDLSAVSSVKTFFTSLDPFTIGLFAVILLAAIFLKKLHPIVFIAAGAVAGIVFQM